MLRRRMLALATVLLAGHLSAASAQETSSAPQAVDTVQGYAPGEGGPAITASPTPTPAATAAPAPTPGGRAAIGAQLGFIDVLPTRSVERIRQERDDAQADLREAEAELAHARSEREKTKAMVEVKKQEVSTINAKRKLAEKSGQEGEQVTLEAEKKDAERHKQFLERRVSLHEAEIDRARAAQKLAEETLRALELETQLVNRRADRSRAAADPAAMRRHDTVILELEGKVLEAERSRAGAQKEVAEKDADIARRRLELHKAQVAAAGR